MDQPPPQSNEAPRYPSDPQSSAPERQGSSPRALTPAPDNGIGVAGGILGIVALCLVATLYAALFAIRVGRWRLFLASGASGEPTQWVASPGACPLSESSAVA